MEIQKNIVHQVDVQGFMDDLRQKQIPNSPVRTVFAGVQFGAESADEQMPEFENTGFSRDAAVGPPRAHASR